MSQFSNVSHCFFTGLESEILSRICEQDVFFPVEIHPVAPEDTRFNKLPEEEDIQVTLVFILIQKHRS